MSSDSDSSDEENVLLYLYYKNKRQRRFWVHPYIEKNINCRAFVAARELHANNDEKFRKFYRMSKESYLNLIQLLSPRIHKKNTVMRECVTAEERILITLRYLGEGCTFTSLASYFARGESTISIIIAETVIIIWDVLSQTYMPIPNMADWKKISERFYLLWNLPNCLGSLDGKHIRIEKLPNTGSANFNYKSYHSIVLLACSDADGLFTFIETGYAGRNSDGGIFKASAIKYWMEQSRLNTPPPSVLPNDDNENFFPYFFVGDEAFPLMRYLMRPYPQRTLTNVKRVFNYRLSRARKTVECAFGMMTEKFPVLSNAIRCRSEVTVANIVKAVCVLHNYVRKREGLPYNPRQFETQQTKRHILIPENLQISPHSSPQNLRDYLANYLITPHASLPWQSNYCV